MRERITGPHQGTPAEPESLGAASRAGVSGEGKAFDEQAVADILKRAAALDQQASAGGASLSQAELEQIARESGIDPAMVRRAIAEREAGAPTATRTPTSRTFERVLEVQLTPAHHERLANRIRAALEPISRGPVQISALSSSLSASAVTSGRALIEVHVSPDGASTRVRVTVNARGLANSFYGGLLGGGGVGLGGNAGLMTSVMLAQSGIPTAMAAAAGVGVFGVIFGGLLTTARALFTRSASQLYERADSLADELVRELEAS